MCLDSVRSHFIFKFSNPIVSERCSIDHMKKVNRFNYLMPLNKDDNMWNTETDTIVRDNQLVNKGLVGKGELPLKLNIKLTFCFQGTNLTTLSGKTSFADHTVERWMKMEEEQFGHDPAMLKWLREGGTFP